MKIKTDYSDISFRNDVIEWEGERKIGRWTVLGPYLETERGERKWLCRCDCGTERYVLERSLHSGGSRSCGCVREQNLSATRSYNLEGMTIGDLSVLRRAQDAPTDSRRGIKWVCRCSCGKECEVLASDLVSGKKTNCGCKQVNYKDISGEKYHFLTALYPLPDRSEKGEILWHCRCDCGNEIDIPYNELVYSNRRSCGCKKEEQNDRLHSFLTHIDQTSIDRIRSKRISSNNTTGAKGVYFHRGRWTAKIVFQRKQYNLGRFFTKEKAMLARLEAESLLFDRTVEHYDSWKERALLDPLWAEQNPVRVVVYFASKPPRLEAEFLPDLSI